MFRSHLLGRLFGAVILAGLAISCSSTPSSPTATAAGGPIAATPTPTPAPTATPTPPPAAGPTPSSLTPTYDNGQYVVDRVTVKIEHVVGVDFKTRVNNPPAGSTVYVGETVRFDCTAKSADNKPTNGSGASDPVWAWSDNGLMDFRNPTSFNPRADALRPGSFWVRATLDGVTSEPFEFVIAAYPR